MQAPQQLFQGQQRQMLGQVQPPPQAAPAPPCVPTWHQPEADAQTRQQVTNLIYQIFSKRRPGTMQPWSNRLPDFIRRLEEALYRTAKSKEEYMDTSTLEARLQDVARRFVAKPNNGQTGPSFGGPGMPNNPLGPGSGMQQPQPGPSGSGMVPMNPGGSQMPMPQQHYQQQGGANPNMQPNMFMNAGGMPSGFIPDGRSDPSVRSMNQGMPGTANPMLSSPVLPGSGLDHGGGMQQPNIANMVPNPGFTGNTNNMSSTLMSNGAPVLIRNNGNSREYSSMGNQGMIGASSSSMVPTNKLTMNGPQLGANGMSTMPQPVPQAPGGFVPSNNNAMMSLGPNMVPVPGGPMGQSSPMINSMPKQPNQGPGPVGSNMVPVGPGPGSMIPMPQNNFQGPMPGGAGGVPGGGMQGSGLPNDMPDDMKSQYVQKQQRWLLFLRHCAKCKQDEQDCQLKAQCKFGKQLWQHILQCANPQCDWPRCTSSKDLLKHHQKCQNPQCLICAPVKEYVRKTRMAQQQPMAQPHGMHGMAPSGSSATSMMPNGMLQPQGMMRAPSTGHQPQLVAGQKRPHSSSMVPNYPGPSSSNPGVMQMIPVGNQQVEPQTMGNIMIPGESAAVKRLKMEGNILSKNTGTSLLETFSSEQIRIHIDQIRAAAQPLKMTQPAPPNAADACTVCELTKLSFEPPVLYCSACNLRIKRGQTFYSTPMDAGTDLKGCWCHACHQDAKGDKIVFGEATIKKSDLVKRKNDEEIEEGWVQCDNCEAWVHQICGMFNKGRNNSDVHYLCPHCLLKGIKSGQRSRIEVRPQAMLESRDLPTCNLSQYLEQRLQNALEQERQHRAAMQGKPVEEIPTSEPLTVRVINSIVKKCEVKPKFYETFQADGYPMDFTYRQRVVLLFQNLDGVDVCLYCMYVQEYGDDCPPPNQHTVYLSYLDSVKYFRPELHVQGYSPNSTMSLRTFVYHQLLLGYLAYVKMLGYEQLFIWACPPMQGDDYILYCHPQKQKVPRSDRLRMWYLEMLKQARSEGTVAHLSTLWDTYFEGGKDHRLERCSATHIPYLEGDYWPGEADTLLANIADGQRQASKTTNKKGAAAAAARKGAAAKGKRYGGGQANTDEQLMSRLGEILGGNMKEDFIVAHLKEVCTFCRAHLDGVNMYRYRAPQGAAPPKGPSERKFEGIKLEQGPNIPQGPITQLTICEKCCQQEQERHATGGQTLLPSGVTPADLEVIKLEPLQKMKDPDGDMENEFFETRQTFLSLCQGNHYQFDTLRRAKHSSMMVLYHLHNPSAPAFTTSCNVCNTEIEPGAGWRCTVCSDFDICTSCKTHQGHPHPLKPHVAKVDETRVRLDEQQRRERNEQLQRTMALLVHACSCNNPACTSSSCRKVRQLFQHAVVCQLKVTGGCQLCKKMWCLLNLHAKSCTRMDCLVPRCRELKELRRRQTARQEEKRRAAYQQMLRQQFAAQQRGTP